MRNFFIVVALLIVVGVGSWFVFFQQPVEEESATVSFTDVEEGFDDGPRTVQLSEIRVGAGGSYSLEELQNWTRPPGPPRVGIQVGHLDNDEVPEELSGLTRNGDGATWGNLTERETVQRISELVVVRLEAAGVTVDLLPATVPPGYVADAFVSIHADGNTNTSIDGYKIASPRRDYAGTSALLTDYLYQTYGEAAGLEIDPSITRRMTAYYAFNWPRYEYAVHPFTPAVIVETGFLTSAVDRSVIVDQPQLAAEGISNGILAFLDDVDAVPAVQPLPFVEPTLPLSGIVGCAPVRAERMNRADEYDCEPSLTDAENNTFILADYSSSTLPVGTEFVADGDYHAIQTLENYFWFPYEVAGIITTGTSSSSVEG